MESANNDNKNKKQQTIVTYLKWREATYAEYGGSSHQRSRTTYLE
jgi:hypothetical protein